MTAADAAARSLYIARLVDAAPPLKPEQRARLTALLAPTKVRVTTLRGAAA